MEESPKAFIAAMEGYYDAREHIQLQDDYEIMAKNEAMDVEAFKGFYNSFEFYDAEAALSIMGSEAYRSTYDEMASFVLENNLTKSLKSVDDLMTTDILTGVIQNEK